MIVRALLAAMVASLALAGPALAGVVVLPKRVNIDRTRDFTIVVRNDRTVDTVRVEVDFPEQIADASLGPPPLDWGLRAQPGGVEYRGGAIPPGEQLAFTVRGRAATGGTAVWRVDQEYSDLSVERWTPGVRVIGGLPPEPDPDPGAGDPGAGDPGTDDPPPPEDPGSDLGDGTIDEPRVAAADGRHPPAWLGFIAILLSLGALAAAGFVWAKPPGTNANDPAPKP